MIAPTFLMAPAVALAVCLASVAPAAALSGAPDAVSAARLPAPVILTPTALETQSSLFALSGTGIPGAHLNIEITDGLDDTNRSFFVQHNGTWSTPSGPDTPLVPGLWRVTATQDTGGPASPPATTLVTVGHTPGGPVAPVITSAAGVVRYRLPAKHMVLRGTGTPGASVIVRLRIPFAGHQLYAFVDAGLADASGRWSVDLNADRRGTVSADATRRPGLRTPLGAKPGVRLQTVLRQVADDDPVTSAGADTVERFGATAYQSDAAGLLSTFARPVQLLLSEHLVAAPRITSPATGARLHGLTQVFAGTGVPHAVISLAIPVVLGFDLVIGRVRVGRNGRWSRPLHFPRTGVWHVHAFQETRDGHDSLDSQVRLTVLRPLPARPLLAGPGGTTDDATPTLCGAGVAGAHLRLLDGSTTTDPTTVGATTVTRRGTWCLTTVRLARGTHRLAATQRVGRLTSLPSAPLELTELG